MNQQEEKTEKTEKEIKYNLSIEAPIYTPKGKNFKVNQLFDMSKTQSLFDDINNSNASEEIKTFLRYAAFRHVVYDYEKIAEFYCHADKETQDLMEKSALVIIDFNKAIENGFVKLSGKIKEQYLENHGK